MKRWTVWPLFLALVVIIAELSAWFGELSLSSTLMKRAFGVLEMIFMLALLWNSWRIREFILLQKPSSHLAGFLSTVSFFALLLCVIGDFVNRNFWGVYYRYDQVIEHSYLADSVWFFFPGYALFIYAAWRLVAEKISLKIKVLSLVAIACIGLLMFVNLVLPGTSVYISVITGIYAITIPMLAVVGGWMLWVFGKKAYWIALGAILAPVADALIGQFWLYGHGYYPAIAYINFMVYFLSQALLHPLPLLASAESYGNNKV